MDYYLISFKRRNILIGAGKILKSRKIPYKVVQTPRNIGLSCSMSMRIEGKYIMSANSLLRSNHIDEYTIYKMGSVIMRV